MAEKDYTWEHATEVVKNGKKYIKCNYCHLEICNGISRMKTHLAGIPGYGKICPDVPQSVQIGFRQNFEEHPVLHALRLKERKKQIPVPTPSHVRDEEHGEHYSDVRLN